jgi:hypothetical protein
MPAQLRAGRGSNADVLGRGRGAETGQGSHAEPEGPMLGGYRGLAAREREAVQELAGKANSVGVALPGATGRGGAGATG